MRNKLYGLCVLVLALGLLVAGCGGGNDNGSSGNTTKSAKASGTDFPAAQLRADLTALLQEHEYLAGIAISQGVGSGLDSAQFKAGADALDANSVDLSKAIGSIYGDTAEKKFLKNWRSHIGFFVNYTKGKATKDAKLVTRAKADLDGYRQTFGEFIAGATNGGLKANDVAAALKPHVASTEAAIDAVVAKSPGAFEKLRIAAGHMPGLADVLAGAIAKQFPDKFGPGVDSPASTLRANLTAGLQEHMYLAAIAVVQGVSVGLDSPAFKAAAGALDKNSVALSKAIGSVYGNGAAKAFLDGNHQWRAHIGSFVDYTKGKATKDAKLVAKAKADLEAYRAAFGKLIHGANPKLPASAVSNDLVPHIQTTFKVIDDVVTKQPSVFDDLRVAASHMPMTAKILSNGIALQYPDKFPADGASGGGGSADHMSH